MYNASGLVKIVKWETEDCSVDNRCYQRDLSAGNIVAQMIFP